MRPHQTALAETTDAKAASPFSLDLPRGRIGINALLVGVALYVSLALNGSFWRQVWHGLPGPLNVQDLRIEGSLFVALNVLLLLLMLPFSARRVVQPAIAVIIVVAAVCSHFMDTYGVVIDTSMIANMVQTDSREAGELLGWPLFLHVGLYGIVPAVLVWRVRLATGAPLGELLRRLVLGVAAVAVLGGCAAANYKGISLWAREHRDIRLYVNPTYALYSAVRYAKSSVKAPTAVAVTPIAEDAVRTPAASGKPRVVLLAIGETARAQNFSLLGYDRPTNPELAAIPGVVAFGNVWSCGTATAISVPCMFSRLGRAHFSRDKARAEENLLDVLKRTGVSVLWRDNNSDCKGVCLRVPSEDLRKRTLEGICDENGCRDEVLLDGLDDSLATTTGDRLIVLHLLGSHGPSYYRRYPAAYRRFVPDCAQDDVQACSREAIVNAYDNTLAYTDHVLAQAIGLLERHQDQVEPTLLYVSDHGESLGESGVYLHGLPYAIAPDEQKHVPLAVWAPKQDLACMQARHDQPSSHDTLFHTVLGLFSVRTEAYLPTSDLLRGC